MKKILIILFCITIPLFGLYACSLQKSDSKNESSVADPNSKRIKIGFSQVGAESDWRAANTSSMKAEFSAENGYDLIFSDAQQKQSNQITAIRSFIQQEVDYIIVAPVTETGWESVLQEAKEANIPVIIVDRMVNVSDPTLFTCWLGSNFELEGRKAAEWLKQFTYLEQIPSGEIHIANIRGTVGASAQIGRSEGLRIAAKENGWDLLAEVDGEFTKAKGREAMEYLLAHYPDLNVVYCENDNEAYGAIEAIEAAGKKTGFDILNGEIMILSFDGVHKEALENVMDGKIACIAECNPLHGARVRAIVEALERKDMVGKYTYVDEDVFSVYSQIKTVKVGSFDYSVTLLTDEIIAKRLELFHSGQ